MTHAAKRNCSRIIFTAPLLSILDQNAHVIRDYMGDDTLILEHHSNLAEPKEAPERLQELELLTASWSAPIIITTLVQLLNLACHPTILGAQNLYITADFFGVLRRSVQGATGMPVMIFNGEAATSVRG